MHTRMHVPAPPASPVRGPQPPGPLVVAVLGKGGAGKTTSALALADALARHHRWRTRLIDLDAQGTASRWIAGTNYRATIADVLTGRTPLADAVVTIRDGLDVVPAHDGLADDEPDIGPDALGRTLADAPVDVVVLDTPASRPLADGAALIRSALDVADAVVVPFQLWAQSTDALAQVLADVGAYEVAEQRAVPTLLLPTRITPRDVLVLEGAVELAGALSAGRYRFLGAIPESGHVGRAASRRQLIADYSPRSGIRSAYDVAAAQLAGALVDLPAVSA